MSALERSWEDRLRELCARYRLSTGQCERLSLLLLELTDEHAPTTVRDPTSAVDVHLADSLVALDVEALASARTIADMGAGAGFPGMPLAVARPESEVFLLESQARKCAFMEKAGLAARIENARVVASRVEEWKGEATTNDVVLARALAPQPVVLEYAAPLLRRGGTFIDWRGRRDPEEERTADAAAGQLGLERTEIRLVEPFGGALHRHLHMFVKIADTPEKFPRRAGMARKRPLGSRRPADPVGEAGEGSRA